MMFLVGHATGVQIYKCTGTAWVFDATSATLVGDNDKTIITHGRGPTWQATDGSTAMGTLPPQKSAIVDPTAIPWLLLQATGSAGPDSDRLAHTTFIQRVNTVGGLAPKGTCDPALNKEEIKVPYAADYFFWKATGGA